MLLDIWFTAEKLLESEQGTREKISKSRHKSVVPPKIKKVEHL